MSHNLFRMSGKIKTIVVGLIVLVLWLSAQLLTPGIPDRPVTGALLAQKDITKIFRRACYDCHSNETRLQWYDKIAPVSWIVASDVREARSRLNFSEWDKVSARDQEILLWESLNQVLSGNMPLHSYKAMHPEAKISNEELESMKRYVISLPNGRPLNDSLRAVAISAAGAELKQFQSQGYACPKIMPVALNGVKYVSGYRKWQVISTTNRFDNNSIRIVYGNQIAVNYIRRNKIGAFPNGATIVKVVWNKIEDKYGNIVTGTLGSVQIMTKDDGKFANTGGWGFGFFNGLKLTPMGAHASFDKTCFNCHKQFTRDNGYLFNIPLKNSDLDPSDKSGIREMYNAGDQAVISSSANANEATISILFGNAQAHTNSLSNAGRHVPGEVLTLVTWQQIHNPRWYGSDINGRLKKIETVHVLRGSGHSLRYQYEVTNGATFRGDDENQKNREKRISYIIGLKPSVFPAN